MREPNCFLMFNVRANISGKKLVELANNYDDNIATVISGLSKRYPKLNADIAYKGSEQGFTIAALTLKDGKNIVGNAAVSVTGAGTRQPVVKTRLSLGHNGETMQYRQACDLAHTPKLEDCAATASYKKGIIEGAVDMNKAGNGYMKINTPEITNMFGVRAKYDALLKIASTNILDTFNMLRNAFSFKEMGVKPIDKCAIEMKQCMDAIKKQTTGIDLGKFYN